MAIMLILVVLVIFGALIIGGIIFFIVRKDEGKIVEPEKDVLDNNL